MAQTMILLITILTAITRASADCPTGWVVFGDSCYLFSHETMDFLDAETICHHYKSHLVHVNTPAENTFLKGHLLTLNGLELEEFYKRRQPIDMSKYNGKELTEVAELPRWHQLNPKQFNDPWTTKHVGKETNFLKREF